MSGADADSCASVPARMLSMASLVSSGEFMQASLVGNSVDPPLALSLISLQASGEVARSPNSVVLRGTFGGGVSGSSPSPLETSISRQPCAIKKPRLPTSTELDRFKKEIRLQARCSHAFILPILAAKLLPPDYALITPLCESNLQKEIHAKGWRPSPSEWTLLASQLAEALSYLHDVAKVIHRDVKPANVMLAGNPYPRHPYLADFGLAEDVAEYFEDKQRTMNGFEEALQWKGPRGGFKRRFQVGTLEYLAPESLMEHEQSPATDVYALAIMMCECVAGVYPFSDCTTENAQCHTILEMGYGQAELQKAVHGEGLRPIVPDTVSENHREILNQMWAHDAAERPTAKQCVALWENAHKEVSRGATKTAAAPAPAPVVADAMDDDDEAPVYDADGTRINQPAAAATTTATATANAAAADPAMTEGTWPDKPAWLPAALPCSKHFAVGAHATAGLRGADRMEDRHVLAPRLCASGDAHLVGVFDGHRGAEVAQYAATHLVDVASTLWRGGDVGATPSPTSTEDFLKALFVSLDAGFAAESARERQQRLVEVGGDVKLAGKQAFPGCTAIAAFVYGDELFIANAGDCRGVLCRRTRNASGTASNAGETVYASLAVSDDHTPDNEKERARVEASGGMIRWLYDSYRIGEVGMQVTRSLGDLDLRNDGLTPDPEVLRVKLAKESDGPKEDGTIVEDLFVVLASDGLFDVLTNSEVIALVNDTVKQPQMAAQRLITEAMTRGSGDNVTAAVLFLSSEMESEETIFSGGVQKYVVADTYYGSRATLAGDATKDKLCHRMDREDTRWVSDEMRDTY